MIPPSLNKYLQPNGPVTSGTQTNNMKFDATFQDGAISGRKIHNFNFSSGQGGTLGLGGTQNGDGVLNVNSANGTTVVRLDNTGINIFSGTITGVMVTTTTIQSGTINNAIIGTSNLVGGTANMDLFKTGGTSGVSGTSIFVKTVDFVGSAVTYGTIKSVNGIVVGIS